MLAHSFRSTGLAVVTGLSCLVALAVAVLLNAPVARAQSDLVVEMMQTGRNDDSTDVRGALAFRVRAFDPSVGNRDGDGIRNVDMIVLDSDGREVSRKRESNAGYCAFGGGEPNCTVYDFSDNNNRWPNGERIRDGGDYTLRAVVTAKDGRRTTMDTDVRVETGENGGGGGSADLVVEMMQTGRNDDSTDVRGALAFRVRAFDPNVGNRDGDGIRNVDMIVLDSDGREVARRRENNAGYCAFGGGEPNCTVYDFSDNNNRWPNGERIRDGGDYTLRAVVTAKDGRRTTMDTDVQVRR